MTAASRYSTIRRRATRARRSAGVGGGGGAVAAVTFIAADPKAGIRPAAGNNRGDF